MPKCELCKHKTHLEFKCPCGGTFCVKCRMPEDHHCAITYEKIKLEKVVAPKLAEKL